MPKKYHIDVQNTPHRYPTIGRSGIVDWGEGCLKCAVCVKQECVYDAYRKRSFSPDIFGDTIDELCKNCFRCVQGCPKRLIHKTLNPEWEALGDDVYTPETIAATWEQAATGKIPVSGAGYGGAYAGPGFDSMWTDMSEIVRPTRDGIHGREYISTVVDIGRRPSKLDFDAKGNILTEYPPSLRIPVPMVFDIPPFGDFSPAVWEAIAGAAATLGTRTIVPESVARELPQFKSCLIPLVEGGHADLQWAAGFEAVEIPDSETILDQAAKIRARNPRSIVFIRVSATTGNIDRIAELAREGAGVIHCVASERGYEPDVEEAAHIKDIIRSVHAKLMEISLRDEVTIIAGGGIAMAEHVIKAMLCGANLVTVAIPLLLALECRVCHNCVEGGECPVRIATIDPTWGSRRMVNLMGAWHNQMLEMMGAMGIREARRLRGEQGRVMFFEDLENSTFARLFHGKTS